MIETDVLEVAAKPGKEVSFRDDLRAPLVVFGRCCVTGEWGKVITIDLGDIAVDAPDTEHGVEYDPETKETKFNVWKPAIFQNQATFSKKGLEMLIDYMDSQANPIPGVTPDLVYAWQVSYIDGSALQQFRMNGEEVEELHAGHIDFGRVSQISVVPRFDTALPTYTFVKETGKIFRNGAELDLDYEGDYKPDSEIIYARKVTHTWGSVMSPNSLNRGIEGMATTVLQLLGWKVGGLTGFNPACIIAIDDRGNWRPWEYVD